MTDLILAASLTTASTQSFPLMPPEVRWLEVRADLAGDLEPAWLRQRFGGALLYVLRDADPAGRTQRLLHAMRAGYDLIEIGRAHV